MSSEDGVGYGRPPKHSQFKKGQSGNPRGRPKGKKNLATILFAAANEKVNVTINGRKKSVTKLEVVVTQLLNKAAAGDIKAAQFVLSLPSLTHPESQGATPLVDESSRTEILKSLRRRLLDGGNEASRPSKSERAS